MLGKVKEWLSGAAYEITATERARRVVKACIEKGEGGYVEVVIESGRQTVRPVTFERDRDQKERDRQRHEMRERKRRLDGPH